ncbi:MAG: ATP-binding protein [Oligosphaeraceae bacterium]
MRRHLEQELIAWKDSPHHKPMLLRGIRQVGKTWLMRNFGQRHFRRLAYASCDKSPMLRQIFEEDFDIHRILPLLEIATGVSIMPNETLLVLDEIQEVPRAVTCLKYFQEDAPDYHIMAAGSLLGIANLQGTGFPVGCVDFLDLHPMTFTEFLEASGQERLAALLRDGDWNAIGLFRDKLTEMLRYYLFVGGMPEPVATFAEHRDFRMVRTLQQNLLRSYDNDFAKHAPKETVARIRMVWNALPSQLAKENRKFVFGALRRGARSSDFELAIQWLRDTGLIHLVFCAAKADIPLAAYQENAFKMMSADVGLLGAQSGLPLDVLLRGNAIFEEFKGALTEQYVHQQLLAECGITPFYWASNDSQCEIDFLYQVGNSMIPHEVKAGENLRAKSLMFFSHRHRLPLAVRSSMAAYRVDHIPTQPTPKCPSPIVLKLLNLPLYALCRLQHELQTLHDEL